MMKIFAESLFLSALALPLVMVGCDTRVSPASSFRSKIDGYVVDLSDAVTLAAGAVPGGVVIDAEYDDDRWEVEVVAEGVRTRVKVDPMTGAAGILSDRPASAEELEAAALVAGAPTSFAQALVAAKGAAPGALPYEIKADGGMFEVDLVNDESFLDVEVDPVDGEVGEVEEDTNEDPEQSDEDDDDEGEGDQDPCGAGEECPPGDGGECDPAAPGDCPGGDDDGESPCPDGSTECGGGGETGGGGTDPGECDPNAEGDCPPGDGGDPSPCPDGSTECGGDGGGETPCPDGSTDCGGTTGGTDPGECDPNAEGDCSPGDGGEPSPCPDGSTDCGGTTGGTDPGGTCDPATGVNCEGNG